MLIVIASLFRVSFKIALEKSTKKMYETFPYRVINCPLASQP